MFPVTVPPLDELLLEEFEVLDEFEDELLLLDELDEEEFDDELLLFEEDEPQFLQPGGFSVGRGGFE